METHPVPQNISSYEFRLVGDMTLKQFLQLAGGTVLAIVAYNMPVPGLIKYPLTFLFALVGVLLAFVPINNRPFSQWLWAFFKAVYSPTEYVWTPTTPTVSAAIQSTSAPSAAVAQPTIPVAPPKTPAATPSKAGFSLFSAFSSPAKKAPEPTPTITTISSISVPAPAPMPVPVPEPVAPPQVPPVAATAPQTVFSAPPPISSKIPESIASSAPLQSLATPPIAAKTAPVPAANAPVVPSPQTVSAPALPNVLAGIVVASGDKYIEGVTVEIIDSATGIPARALRTNRLGQFQIAIPLANGSYVVNAEKEGFMFDPVSIAAKGALIPPVTLFAKPV